MRKKETKNPKKKLGKNIRIRESRCERCLGRTRQQLPGEFEEIWKEKDDCNQVRPYIFAPPHENTPPDPASRSRTFDFQLSYFLWIRSTSRADCPHWQHETPFATPAQRFTSWNFANYRNLAIKASTERKTRRRDLPRNSPITNLINRTSNECNKSNQPINKQKTRSKTQTRSIKHFHERSSHAPN